MPSQKLYHPRPVELSQREAVDVEINKLDSEGIISPVDASDWVTGVVPVPKKDGKVRIENCESCQTSDISGGSIKAPVRPVEYPCRPMAKSNVDIMGPYLNAPRGYKYFTIWMDYYRRWPELMATEVLPTSGEIIHFLKRAVISTYGIPEDLVTDNGSQFVRAEFESFLNEYGLHHSRTVPYNPPANGLVERFNRELKQGLQVSRFHRSKCLQG